ncbi:MAG: hypothetical protein QHH09_03795 [Microgenomates group bacterium]|nr:hypothetical protein [Microgenomates group bacterium]
MKKIFISIFIIGLCFLKAPPIYSQTIAGNSAALKKDSLTDYTTAKKYMIAKMAIKKILEKYQSPLIDATDNFIQTCWQYQLDCYLLPSIAGLESTFGKFIYPNSYNPFGWGGGYIVFNNWQEAIDTVGKGLRERYLEKGCQNLKNIGQIYSESPTWAMRVDYFLNQFYQEEKKLLYLAENPVQL